MCSKREDPYVPDTTQKHTTSCYTQQSITIVIVPKEIKLDKIIRS